jgi:putative cardiolipin synthase
MKNLILAFTALISVSGFAQTYSDMIPAPFYSKVANSKTQVRSITTAPLALQLRLDMIRRATKSIEAEYFIFNTDLAGKIMARELVAAAKRKVKVRVLIDKSIAVLELDEFYAKELKKNGVEVRYYNSAPLYKVSTMQFRNHRKLLSVDDREAITGGRNIGDDYFNLSTEFNFNDHDIYVKGPIVVTMRKSFDKFFEHEITERPEFPTKSSILDVVNLSKYDEKTAKAKAFLIETQQEIQVRKRVAQIGNKLLASNKLHVCPIATFSTDGPGADFQARLDPNFDEHYRFLRKTIYDKINTIDQRILISSPYILNNDNSRELMDMLLQKGVTIDVYTNSLGSTDAVYVAANLYLTIESWYKKGINITLHDGKYIKESDEVFKEIPNAQFGTHTKAQVYESKAYSEVMIGTYNVDNRSNFYNSEMAFFCRGNNEFTAEVKGNINSRMNEGLKVGANGTAKSKKGEVKDIHSASKSDIVKMKLITVPSWLLKFML